MKVLAILALVGCLVSCIIPLTGASSTTDVLTPSQTAQAAGAPISGEAPFLIQVGDVSQVRLLDLASGHDDRAKPALALPAGEKVSASQLAAGGSLLALVSGFGQVCRRFGGGSACYQASKTLHLVDIATWRMADVALEGQGYVSQLAFSPDRSRLALVFNTKEESSLLLYDVSSGERVAQRDLSYQPEWLAYALGGVALAIYGVSPGPDPGVVQPPSPSLQLLDPETLQSKWGLRMAGMLSLEGLLSGEWCLKNCTASHEQRRLVYWKPALTLSPDGRRLYIVHADRDRLTIVDLEKGDVQNAVLFSRTAWLERFLESTARLAPVSGSVGGASRAALISPDGQRLVVLTHQYSPGVEPAGEAQSLQVIHLSRDEQGKVSGRVLVDVELDPELAFLSLLPAGDGALYLSAYAGGSPLVQRIAPGTLLPSASLAGWQVVQGPGVLLGQRPSGRSSELAAIHPLTLQVLRSWPVDGETAWLPFSSPAEGR
jgi:hypothetical protein